MSAKELKQLLGEYLKGTDFKEINNTISIQKAWKKLLCKWNWLVSKLIVDVQECPVAQCVCKK